MFKRFYIASPRKMAAFIAAATFGLAACSSENSDIANGTGSNAGEAELANLITVTAPSGKPLARAATRIWTMNRDTMEVEWSDTLDTDGQLKFKGNLSGQHLLESHSGDSLSVMRWVNFGKETSQTLSAAASVSLKGRITDNGAPLKGVTVSILDKKASTNDNGEFTINGIPAGVHYAFVEGVFGKFNYQMQTGLGELGSTNNIDVADSIFTVIEDFENWDQRQSLIGKSFGEGWWFICTDSLQGGGSHNTDLFSKDLVVTGDDAKNGSSMHAVFDLDESFEGHFGVTGFNIGGDFDNHEAVPAFYDLSSMRAISFDAKGHGRLFLQVTKHGEDGKKEFHRTNIISLNGQWDHFTFTADDFETEMRAINSINFVFEQDGELYLDNVRLDGISPSMWPSLGMDFDK